LGIRNPSDRARVPDDGVFLANHFVRKKISPVISPILQANRSFLENITGDNRCAAFRSVARVRQLRPSGRALVGLFRRRACLDVGPFLFHARFTRGRRPNMATQTAARNRTFVRSEKIVGTKIESLTDFSREFSGGSEGYGG
jgi:hypothetical protein